MKHNDWMRAGLTAGLAGVLWAGLAWGQPADKPAEQPAKPPTPQTPKPETPKPDAPKPTAPAAPEKPIEARPAPVSPDVLTFVVKDIDGKDQDLRVYRGKVVLIVNVASKCGFTKQYEGLQKLYESLKDRGFVVLGFPANDFLNQEPEGNEKIKAFCTQTYGVTFPMFAKVSVVAGPSQAPLYKHLAMQPSPIGGDPKWNFTKFLVDREGKVVARYEPRVKPDDEALRKRIEELLGPTHEAPAAPAKPAGN